MFRNIIRPTTLLRHHEIKRQSETPQLEITRENRKRSPRNQPGLRGNLKKCEDKLKSHEDNPKKIGDYPKYQDIYELLSDNICQ